MCLTRQFKNPVAKLRDVECGLCEYVVNYVKQEIDDPLAQEQIKESAIAVSGQKGLMCPLADFIFFSLSPAIDAFQLVLVQLVGTPTFVCHMASIKIAIPTNGHIWPS